MLISISETFKLTNLILPIVISVFIIALTISISLSNQKMMVKTFVFAFLNLFWWIIALTIFDKYIKTNEIFTYIYLGLMAFELLFFFILCYISFRNAVLKSNQYQLIINGVKKTKYNAYYLIDSKDRIIDIADSLVEELGAIKEEVVGKKLFDVFDRTIRIKKFNDTEVNNKMIREFYSDYAKTVKSMQQDIREIHFQNFNGTTIILNIIEQPVFVLGQYRGRLSFGEKRATSSMMSMERELVELKGEFNALTSKFQATLDVTEEGLFFYDLEEQYVWGTDIFKKTMGLTSNTISIEDLKGLMYEDDLAAYKNTLNGLTEEKSKYSATYRTYRNGSYVWVKEHGKRIYDADCPNLILGFVKPIESGNYEKSNTELDNVKNDLELYKDLQILFQNNRMFQIAIINVSNIPEVNNKYGRNIGNIMLNEYTRRLRQNFSGDQLYRISGLEFVFIITEPRKMEMLKTSLQSDNSAMDLQMDYGSIKEVIKVQIGIADAHEDGTSPEEVLQSAKKALSVAKNPNFKKSVCYYKEIR